MTSAAVPLPDEGLAEAGQGRFTESPTGLLNNEDDSDGEDEEGGVSAEEEEDGQRDDGQEPDEESEDDSEDDEDSDDDEPVLKYSRIEGSVPEVLKKDSASAVAVSGNRLLALGTHAGIVHVLDLSGKRIKSYKPHLASIVDIEFDETGEFIATASIDGQVYVRSLATNEFYTFNLKRPMRTIALEPHFASKRSTRAFVAGGLAGNLILYDKGWLGHRETVISSGEGPIWQVRWVDGKTTGSGGFIAWANDLGVKIYHPDSRTILTFIDRPPNSPRAELFKPTLHWQDESTLLVAWADYLKVARIRTRSAASSAGAPNGNAAAALAPYTVEVTAVFQMDACVVAGIVPHPMPPELTVVEDEEPVDTKSTHSKAPSTRTDGTAATADSGASSSKQKLPIPQPHLPRRKSVHIPNAPPLTTFLLLTYIPPPSLLTASNESDEPPEAQKRRAAERPELRIVSRTTGEELANDVLGVRDFEKWGCNEYSLALVPGEVGGDDKEKERCYVVMSPRDLVIVRKRDRRDRVKWLVERGKWEEALKEVEELERTEDLICNHTKSGGEVDEKAPLNNDDDLSVQAIGQKYIHHLLSEHDYAKAASLLPKVCGRGKTKAIAQRWEEWIWEFAGRGHLHAAIPYVPTDAPRLDHVVYEMVLGHFLGQDLDMLLQTIKTWPREIYDVAAVVVAVKAKLDKLEAGSPVEKHEGKKVPTRQEEVVLLMECLAELYTANRQPGKALPYYLRLRRPNVFELIRDNNLFTDVQDQVLLLVEFDHELMEKRKKEKKDESKRKSEAIELLVDNIHSIPINRVVQQLQKRPDYLFLYLDALVEQDPHLVAGFADLQVKMYAEFATDRLIDFLRTSNYYNLEQAYKVCKDRDLVPEMVFLLGRMGNNKQALTLIIERLGDVHRAIDFAKQQNDDDLWEDLLRYSETRPTFIRGLLENVGVEISPVRLIRRIKNGLEIPGLKEALIKILQDFQLQIELLEGCKTVLEGDCGELVDGLHKKQSGGFWLSAGSKCPVCSESLSASCHWLVPHAPLSLPARSSRLLRCRRKPPSVAHRPYPSRDRVRWRFRTGNQCHRRPRITHSTAAEARVPSLSREGCARQCGTGR
ncbi:vacuolar protein sorting-associated protein 41 [Coprinellus micaceus]|uniref:Vacuolar protein sorting-associated protein 41 n=1 Tax=Coprinellus micaceus TaxID=71717 RepID=A0A4Y7SPI8_COPMI|nr:vacuolar protein sorting-associated protein 41 [Coprinellus micaceus]